MANERQELSRLRKVKRLKELEAREVASITSPANVPAEVAEDKGFFDGVGEFFSGSDRQTRATQELPEIGRGGLLFGEDQATAKGITPALLTATNPNELGQILAENFPSIGITSDEKGNLIANNNRSGVKVVLNQPGVSQFDVLQGLGIAAAFTPAGRVAGPLKLAGAVGGTSAGIEALQALSGGEFDASQVVIDAVTAGALDKAFEVAKATGRSIRDVLKKDANIDPDQILKSFTPKGYRSRQYSGGKRPQPGRANVIKINNTRRNAGTIVC